MFLFCIPFRALLNTVDALTGGFLLILVACLLLVAGLPTDALTAFLGAVCVALCCCLCLDTVALLLEGVALFVGAFFFGAVLLGAALLALDTVALLLDALVVVLVFLLLLGALFLAPEPLVFLLRLLLDLALLLLVPAPLDLCLLRDRRPRRPPLLAISLPC